MVEISTVRGALLNGPPACSSCSLPPCPRSPVLSNKLGCGVQRLHHSGSEKNIPEVRHIRTPHLHLWTQKSRQQTGTYK
ncbi:hypothetical protein GN956_G11149 [Arapaima gigas]